MGKRAHWTETRVWELCSAVLQTLCRTVDFSCPLFRLHCPPVTRRHWPQWRGLGSAGKLLGTLARPSPCVLQLPPLLPAQRCCCNQVQSATQDVVSQGAQEEGILQAGGEGTEQQLFSAPDQLSCLCSSYCTRSRAVSVSPQ